MIEAVQVEKSTRVDMELRKIGYPGHYTYEFRALNSYGQTFLEQEMMLQNTGTAVVKMFVNDLMETAMVTLRAIAEGLKVEYIPLGGVEKVAATK